MSNDQIEELRRRIEAVEIENAAFSVLFAALGRLLGPHFLEVAADASYGFSADPELSSAIRKRFTEAIRIIDDIRVHGQDKPKPDKII